MFRGFARQYQEFTVLKLDDVRWMQMAKSVLENHVVHERFGAELFFVYLGCEHVGLLANDGHVAAERIEFTRHIGRRLLQRVGAVLDREPAVAPTLERQQLDLKHNRLSRIYHVRRHGELVDAAIAMQLKLPV